MRQVVIETIDLQNFYQIISLSIHNQLYLKVTYRIFRGQSPPRTMQYHQSNTYVIRPDDNITSSLMKMEEQTYRKLNNTFNLITYFDINMKHAYSWEMRAPGHKPWRVCVSSRDEHYIVHNNLDARHNAHNHFTPV